MKIKLKMRYQNEMEISMSDKKSFLFIIETSCI